MNCFVCGFDGRTVKLTQIQISSTKETRGGKAYPGTRTVCTDCKPMVIAGNHPESAPEQGPEKQGFIKKSEDGEATGPGHPAVRPE